jgi:phosphohistidine swiveling domain-containing protein
MIDKLEPRRRTLIESDSGIVSNVYWLLEACAQFGTLPFAGLARCDFIGTQLLRSLVALGIMSEEDYECLLRQSRTVSADMARDQSAMTHDNFMLKYGHLRPGTYDITSPRYDDPLRCLNVRPDRPHQAENKHMAAFSLSIAQHSAIATEMARQGLAGDTESLLGFIKAGIEGREYAKFIFTKALSDVLELMAALGAEHGFSRDQMSFVDIRVIDELYCSGNDPRAALERAIAAGMKAHERALTFTLPPLITRPDDIYAFHMPTADPNFVTVNKTLGEVCTDYSHGKCLTDKIVMIPAADPGFDWIFLHGIRGFITAYGGANSHMAIRAMQLNIPAVIGAGERRFAQWAKAKALHIDCANKKVDMIQ